MEALRAQGARVQAVSVPSLPLAIAVYQRLWLLRADVLVERAAVAHINQLQSPANAKHRFARGHKSAHQFHLVQITRAVTRPARV